METKIKKIVGIDISKLTIDVYDGNKHCNYPNNYVGFKALTKENKGHYVMEATGNYHIQLATYLNAQGYLVSVVNPLIIKRFSQMKLIRAKTDKKDAMMIFDFAQMNKLALWQAPKKYLVQVKQIFTAIDLMLKHRTASKNQLEAFDQMDITGKEVIIAINKQIKALTATISLLEQKAERLILENVKTLYTKLKTIPSIGKKSAMLLIVVTNEFKNFVTTKQLASYIGISPRVYKSGTSINGKGSICKMGMSQIRKTLYMSSLSAIRYNSACKKMFDRLTDNGKPKKLALVAVMNKLLKQAFAIGTKLEDYYEVNLN